MLTTCHECQAQISSHATSCPKCGCPTGGVSMNVPGVRAIEATGKPWKLLQAIGAAGVIAFAIWGVVMAQEPSTSPYDSRLGFAFLGGAASLVLFVIARLGAWWYHG